MTGSPGFTTGVNSAGMGVFMLQKKREICYYKGEVETTHNLIKGCITEEIVDSLYSLTKFDFY